ncbi:MAG: HEPN domain-containing protein [Geoalkalibacter sp.]|jgi:HEPN domain-containing protein|uniref:HEPN domain-containing protein n=1 Tax=Geoalkalibacter sp. TaxID=3041440 RepID=UPI003D0DE4F6
MKKLTEEWLRAAKDDLDVIEKILGEAHLSHITAFHAQQCIEKAFKAVYEEHGIESRKIHNLITLYGGIEEVLSQEMDLALLKTLDSLYIEARYPGELGLLPSGRPSLADAEKFYNYTKSVYQGVRTLLARR